MRELAAAMLLIAFPTYSVRLSVNGQSKVQHNSRSSAHMNFFQNLREAFENEAIDGPIRRSPAAGVLESQLNDVAWRVTLSVKGISSANDPSSDLYGAKASVREGAMVDPIECTLEMTLEIGGGVHVVESDLTAEGKGRWWLTPEGELQLQLPTPGLERTSTWRTDTQRPGFGALGSSSLYIPAGSLYLRGKVSLFGTSLSVPEGSVSVRVEKGRYNVVFKEAGKWAAVATSWDRREG